MDNGTIVLEILRNLSNDDVYTLIDVFENHNDDEECMKEFNKVVNKIQNTVNKLDSNFLTNFKDKRELAYFMYDMAMDYHSNDLTQEKIDKKLDFFRKNKMNESTNKYVLAFREAVEKLEEKQDFSNSHWDEIPPEKHTEKQLNAINEFDNLVKQVQEGLITRKEFIQRADILYNDLPDFDWTRDSDAKLPNELFPNDNKVKNTNPSIQEILDGNYEI